jgi:hypothetical protein
MPSSHLEDYFERSWQELYPEIALEREVKSIPGRRFRLDFAHTASKVGIEIEGQIWHKSRHTSGSGLLKSYEKHNLNLIHGWRVFQLAEDMICPDWLNLIADTIKGVA